MRFFGIALLLCGAGFAQVTPPPKTADIPDSTVVATVGDKKYTAGELRAMMEKLPPQVWQYVTANPANGLAQLLTFDYLASEAEKEQLDKQSPYKQELELQRTRFLAQARMNEYLAKIVIPAEEQDRYYRAHAEDFQQAKVRVIYVAFSKGQVKSDRKVLTEDEAKAKIDQIRKKLVAGGDFAELAKQDSDDKDSAEKGGEWGIVKRNSNQPAEVKNAIFSLKSGAISEPVKQPNGFYIFKVDEFTTQPLGEVSSQIGQKLRQQRYEAWVKGIQDRFKVTVNDQEFFGHPSGAPAVR